MLKAGDEESREARGRGWRADVVELGVKLAAFELGGVLPAGMEAGSSMVAWGRLGQELRAMMLTARSSDGIGELATRLASR